MPLYTERCSKCGERNMTVWEYLDFDECSFCRVKGKVGVKK